MGIRAPFFIELLMVLWPKEVILLILMELEENLFMEKNLLMRILN